MIPLILMAALAVWWLLARMSKMESTIAALTTRVSFLERPRAYAPIIAPAPSTVPPAPKPAARPQTPYVSAASTTTVAVVPEAHAVAPEGPQSESLETRIGSRWLLYVGVVAIVVGVSYFEKLAIENQWIGETARVIQGAMAGLVLIGIGLRFIRAGYRIYGQVLSGCGIAILYVSTYAAFTLYHLVSRPTAFGLMSLVTVIAASLADKQRSQSLAIVAVGGGFATPFLLPSAIDAHVALFSYEMILIAGTMFLARRREWRVLNIVGYAFTVLTVAGWAAHFYERSKYLSTELFITVYCAMFLYILRQRRNEILWTAPFVYYLASLALLWVHAPALLAFLMILSLVGVLASSRAPRWVRIVFSLAVIEPLLLWSNSYAATLWLASGLTAWTSVYLLNLAGLLEATLKEEADFGGAEIAVLHLNGLAAYLGAYLLIEPAHASAAAPLAAAFAVWHGMLASAIFSRRRELALHFAALAFTLLTIASGLHFEGAWATCAWAAEGAVIIWLALRERREWLRVSGLVLFAVAIGRLIVELLFSHPSPYAHVLFNQRALGGLFVIALTYLVTFAHARLADPARRHLETGIGLVTAKLLVLAVAVTEIIAFWRQHAAPPYEPASQIVVACLSVGAVTMCVGLVRRQEWIRGVGGAVVALGGMALLSTQLAPAPIGYVTLLNGRAAAGIFAVAVLYALAVLHNRRGSHVADLSTNQAVLIAAASLFTLSLLTSEINAFWAARGAGNTLVIAREGLQTIAWASVGSFLIWRGVLERRGWIRGVGAVLLLTAVLRLLLLQFVEPPAAYIAVVNARVMAALIIVGLLYGLSRLYRNAAEPLDAGYRPYALLLLVANVVTLSLFTSEITAYWGTSVTSNESHFAREMMLSVTWAVYATLLIVAGLKKHYAPIRYFAIAVFVITVVKVFAVDLSELDRIYRVLSVIGLGVTLLLSSYMYQRFQRERIS